MRNTRIVNIALAVTSILSLFTTGALEIPIKASFLILVCIHVAHIYALIRFRLADAAFIEEMLKDK